jgi:hypothetical protein
MRPPGTEKSTVMVFDHGSAQDVLFPRGSNREINLEEDHAADYQQQKVPERGPGILD